MRRCMPGSSPAPGRALAQLDIAGDHRRQPAGRARRSVRRPAGRRADGRALHRRRGGARRRRRCWRRRAPPGRPACRRVRCIDRSRAAPPPGADRRGAGRAAAARRWSPSPAPTARPARSSSCASSGPSAGEPAASLGTLGLIAPGFDAGPGPDHARPGQPGRDAGRPGARRRAARGDGGLLARAGPVPPGRRAAGGGGVHQPDARPPRLPRHAGGLPRGQAAAVRRAAARGRARRRAADMDAATLAALREIAARRRLDLRTVGETGTRFRLLAARAAARRAGC